MNYIIFFSLPGLRFLGERAARVERDDRTFDEPIYLRQWRQQNHQRRSGEDGAEMGQISNETQRTWKYVGSICCKHTHTQTYSDTDTHTLTELESMGKFASSKFWASSKWTFFRTFHFISCIFFDPFSHFELIMIFSFQWKMVTQF